VRLDDLGLDRRLVAALVIGTLAAVGVGYLVAAGLDGGNGRTAAVAPPAPAVSPEAQDDGPLGAPPILPPVTVGTPPPTPAPPPATPAAAPVPRPPTAAPPATTAPAATTAPPPTTARLPTTTTGPTTTTTEPQPFRPRPASTPLAEFVVPPNELPPDAAKAMAGLSRAAARARPGTTTAADIAYVTRLGARFATTAVSGRREAVSRTVRLNAWWYAHRDAPTGRVLVRDPDGLIYSYNAGHGFALNPVGTAGRWQRLNADVSAQALADTLMSVGVTSTRGGRRTLTWEYFDVPGVPDAIRPGVSGMAQARIAQLIAGAYNATGDPRFAAAAGDAIASLAVGVGAGGARGMVAYPAGAPASPWYVERAYPGESPWMGAALNGFMVAILELRIAERSLRDAPAAANDPSVAKAADEARRLADEGAATLQRYLPLHDSGKWSYYGLLTPGHPWRTYLANATYHCYHVTLLQSLDKEYPERTFGATARKWAGYATRQGVRCA
jgi:hypothetical protein